MQNDLNLQGISKENIDQMLHYVYEDLVGEDTRKEIPNPIDYSCIELEDMVTDLLMQGIVRQLRRGLYKGYVQIEEPSIMIRGKMNMQESVRLRSQLSHQLVCTYDIFDKDNLYNQILKSTCLYILRQGRISKVRRKKLKDLLHSFYEVSEIPLRTVNWENIRFHKDKFAYRSLIGLCYLAYKGIRVHEETGKGYLNEMVFSDLYERFIEAFYKKEWPQIRMTYQGKYNSSLEGASRLRNRLTLDLLLTYEGYRLVLNTHYFEELFEIDSTNQQVDFIQGQLERQLGTVKRNEFNEQGTVEGYFLFPAMRQRPIQCYEVEGRKVYFESLDLSGTSKEVRKILMNIGDSIVKRGTTR